MLLNISHSETKSIRATYFTYFTLLQNNKHLKKALLQTQILLIAIVQKGWQNYLR